MSISPHWIRKLRSDGNGDTNVVAVKSLRPRSSIVYYWGICSLFSLVILVHLGLVGMGQWLADEYDDFGRLSRDGWSFVWDRLRWSPRPLSELLYCTYGWIVNHVQQPMIGTFLGMLWAGLIAICFVTFWQNRKDASQKGMSPDLPVALAVVALFLTGGGRKIWILYWPAAAVAYLPTLSATVLFFLQVVRGALSNSGGRLLCSSCLIVAACSSEMGAIFVLCYGVVQSVQLAIRGFHRTRQSSPSSLFWWLLPTLLSIVPLVTVWMNRFQATELPGVQVGPTKGHPFISLIVSAQQLSVEVLGRSPHSFGWRGLGAALFPEILLFLGVYVYWAHSVRLPNELVRQIIPVLVALWFSSLFTIAAANVHFGIVCCDQHEILRRCWILMSIVGLGILTSAWIRWRYLQLSPTLAYIFLCVAVLSPWHVRPILQTYSMYGSVRKATEQNFQAGFHAGNGMDFFLLPETLVAQPQVAPGIYRLGSTMTSDVHYILTFFKKSSMRVLPTAEWLHTSSSQKPQKPHRNPRDCLRVSPPELVLRSFPEFLQNPLYTQLATS